jgi:hypothetical protein
MAAFGGLRMAPRMIASTLLGHSPFGNEGAAWVVAQRAYYSKASDIAL